MDDVTQFCIEEATLDYLEQREAIDKPPAFDGASLGGEAQAEPEWQNAMEQAKAFAKGAAR